MPSVDRKPSCGHYIAWKDAPEPLQMDECIHLEQEPHGYRQVCDMGLQHEYFQKECPWAKNLWGHE